MKPANIRPQNPATRYAVEMHGKQILEILRFDFGTPAESARWRDAWVSEKPGIREARAYASVAAQIQRTRAKLPDGGAWQALPSLDPRGTATDLHRLRIDRAPRASALETDDTPRPPALATLTPAQYRVLRCHAESPLALTSYEIAARLELSTATVNAHFAAIFRKLGVNDREAAETAYRKALVTP